LLATYDIIITTDRSMMSNHRGKEFLGFMSTAPPVGLPDAVWRWIATPKLRVDDYGRPEQAPYGLRKIEAALQDAGYSAAIIDPDHVRRYIYKAKAIFIGHHDYFAFNPPSSEYWLVTGEEPLNRRLFLQFIEKIADYKERLNPDLKIIVGGPAAWQWLHVPGYVEKYKIDTIVEGEGERVVIELAHRIINGEKLPRYIVAGPFESPSIEEIPVIKGPSINGLVEIMRGCPRGCAFCSVTLRKLRFIPLEVIEKEVKINRQHGIKGGILHSEDVPLYGGSGITPNIDSLLKLHRVVSQYYEDYDWSHAALATLLHGEKTSKLVSRLSETLLSDGWKYLGFQTGIETGSPRLAAKIMPGKAAPFKPDKWPDVVREVMPILHDNFFIPAATVILGFPGETPDDVVKTIELIDDLKPYRVLIVPMFFVPMGALRREDWFTSVNITYEHAELLQAILKHSLYWSKDILRNFYMNKLRYLPFKYALLSFIRRAEKFSEELTPEKILYYIENSKKKLASRTREKEVISSKHLLRKLVSIHN